MTKIGVDISDLHAGHADGTTRFTYEVAQRLPALIPEAEWLYFSSGQPSNNYELQTTNHKLVVSKWPRFWTQLRFPFDLLRFQPDVLFMPIQQLPALRPRGMKTVCVVHDLAWQQWGEYFTAKDWLLQHTFTAAVAREADHIIAVSQATADDIERYYGRTQNVHVVHHGVDHARFRPPADETEKARGWEALQAWQPKLTKPYILYVGQIQPRKNLERLIEAFERLKRPVPQTGRNTHSAARNEPLADLLRQDLSSLVLAGSHGWLNKPIYERAQKSSVTADILLPGRVPEELLPALYWHADVFVLPSLYEGFGLPVLEAMACGTPTVTSNVSSLPEVAGSAAILVDPEDTQALAAGIGEARTRAGELSRAGILQAASFTWDRTAEQIASILNSL